MRIPRWLLVVTAILLAMAAAALTPSVDAAGPVGTTIPPSTGCTNPAHHGPSPSGGLEPRQLAAAYGVDALWAEGHQGQGMHVALIEPGERLDWAKYREFADCWGPFVDPVETVIGGGTPAKVGGEPQLDSYAVLAMAPRLARLDLIESATGATSNYPALLSAALDPNVTGGKLVDAISISFGHCEPKWDLADLAATNAVLARAAAMGVKVFAAQGDSGSVGSYLHDGEVECVGHPVDPLAPIGVELSIGFPGSSPWVTGVGGTELAIDGAIPHHGSPAGGAVTDEVVWNEPSGGGRMGGSGGVSRLFPIADAPWQRTLGLAGMVHKPDISSMAGSPKFFDGSIGTSGASPMVAGAMVVLDGYLLAKGAPKTGFLNPLLYELAAGPHSSSVFYDVTEGDNDFYDLGCCHAGPGYDTASGLGSIRFDRLAAVLLERAGITTTTTTATASAGEPFAVPRYAG